MYLKKWIKLIRIEQWYKNLLIFSALFFSGNLTNYNSILIICGGFILLCMASSSMYIINDIIDKDYDLKNPDKKNRPIASGNISIIAAALVSFILIVLTFCLSFYYNVFFGITVFFIILNTFFYSVFFKNMIFLDLISIALNFLARAIAGVYLLAVNLSPWFLMGILFASFLLVSAKRYGDLVFMKDKAKDYKPVLKKYNLIILDKMIIIFSVALIIIFGLYAHFSNLFGLFYLYPIFIYMVLKYLYYIYENDSRIRNPEKLIAAMDLVIPGIIFCFGVFWVIYL